MAVEIFAAGRFLLLFVGWGGLSVGKRRTGPRWIRGSSTLRYSTSPPHQSAPLTASPQGEAYVLCYVVVFATVVFYSKPHRLCQSPSPGGEGGPALRAGSDEGER